jgi:molybdopterin synthase sulfur carrier subunit
MPTVELTEHLFQFFPELKGKTLRVDAKTAADVVRALDAIAPGIAEYIVDERGALRMHVNLFIGDEMIVDRRRLSDPVSPDAHVYVFQALSGG